MPGLYVKTRDIFFETPLLPRKTRSGEHIIRKNTLRQTSKWAREATFTS